MREWLTGSADVLFRRHDTLNLHFTDRNERSASGDGSTTTERGVSVAADTAVDGVALRKLFVTRLVESAYTGEWRYAAVLS
jgi:hypothetical protein